MNRRNFLRLMSGAGTVAALPPSMVWPFRKIFLPPAPKIFNWELLVSRDAGEDEVYFLHPDQARALVQVMSGSHVFDYVPDSSTHNYLNLSRSSYPGKLGTAIVTDVNHEKGIVTYANQKPWPLFKNQVTEKMIDDTVADYYTRKALHV